MDFLSILILLVVAAAVVIPQSYLLRSCRKKCVCRRIHFQRCLLNRHFPLLRLFAKSFIRNADYVIDSLQIHEKQNSFMHKIPPLFRRYNEAASVL